MANIKTAILVEYQVFWHFGHRFATLFLDDGQSVIAKRYDLKSRKVQNYKLKAGYFSTFSTNMNNRVQSVPVGDYGFNTPKVSTIAWYIGVISHFSKDRSRQQLITIEDLMNKKMKSGDLAKELNTTQKNMKPIYENN